MTSTIGELKFIKDDIELEWQIRDFFTLTKDKDTIVSPDFYFAGASWYIRIYPNGLTDRSTEGNIDCYVMRRDSGHAVNLEIEMGLKKIDGSIHTTCTYNETFDDDNCHGMGIKTLFSMEQLSERTSDLAPSNIVTINCKLTGDKEIASSVRGFTLKDLYQLSDNLKELLKTGNGSDLTVMIKDKEFKLHKCILGVRSPLFLSAMKEEMENNLVSVVNISDFEEAEFEMFQEYIYTGQVKDILKKNFFSLYKIAEKYKITELQKDCLNCVKETLSKETFFDAVELEENYHEEELHSLISKFCADNLKELVQYPNWLIFMQENATKAYDMLTMALDNYVKS